MPQVTGHIEFLESWAGAVRVGAETLSFVPGEIDGDARWARSGGSDLLAIGWSVDVRRVERHITAP
jgi:hypothetical protein